MALFLPAPIDWKIAAVGHQTLEVRQGLGGLSATASWFGERREAAGSDGWHSVVEPRAGGQSEQGERQVKKVIEGTEALKVSILWSMP